MTNVPATGEGELELTIFISERQAQLCLFHIEYHNQRGYLYWVEFQHSMIANSSKTNFALPNAFTHCD